MSRRDASVACLFFWNLLRSVSCGLVLKKNNIFRYFWSFIFLETRKVANPGDSNSTRESQGLHGTANGWDAEKIHVFFPEAKSNEKTRTCCSSPHGNSEWTPFVAPKFIHAISVGMHVCEFCITYLLSSPTCPHTYIHKFEHSQSHKYINLRVILVGRETEKDTDRCVERYIHIYVIHVFISFFLHIWQLCYLHADTQPVCTNHTHRYCTCKPRSYTQAQMHRSHLHLIYSKLYICTYVYIYIYIYGAVLAGPPPLPPHGGW